jgi:hypothetical protein
VQIVLNVFQLAQLARPTAACELFRRMGGEAIRVSKEGDFL